MDTRYIFSIITIIVGIIMIKSPRSFMRKAKYDEEGMRTEKWVKRLGIAAIVYGIVFAIIAFIK